MSLPGGPTGNLICKLPGSIRGPRRLLMAHMDTVPLAVGATPVRQGDELAPADANTALGADDRAGTAAVLAAALEVLRRGLPHPPLTFLWTVQEEIGLFGARHVAANLLGNPRLAFNFDGRSPDEITVGATGGYRLDIHVRGIPAHAGVAPEKGVSAIAVAADAVARLQREGWHGRIENDGRWGTSNVGVIHGGEATNVVPDFAEIQGTLRTFTVEAIDLVERRMKAIAEHTAAAFDCTVEFEFVRNYPPTINHPAETDFCREVMADVVGADNVLEFEPTMGSEDFSYFLLEKPGCYVVIGNGEGGHREAGHGLGPCVLHNPNYDFNDELIPIGASYWVRLAERWLAAR